jgi:hypothetical protein
MKACTLVGRGLVSDNIFNLENVGNRDDCYEPYVLLADTLRANGYDIHTQDCISSVPAFAIHIDVQKLDTNVPAYLLLSETPTILPVNLNVPAAYRKVFSWDDTRIDDTRFIKINLPNRLTIPAVDGFTHRDRFCCVIAGNKAAAVPDSRELYSERVRAIRWFEKYAPQDFDLYGTSWDIPPVQPGLVGKLVKRLWGYAPRYLRPQPFPSYRGKVERKHDVLQRTRFSICYENVRDMPGYITEKIFDCFFAGCVPIYWGANNVADHIPADCYIDRRQFADTAATYAHLKAIDEATYRGYQERISVFLASDAAKPFGSEFFVETIVSTIMNDIGYGA